MPLVTVDQLEEFKSLVQAALDAMDVEIATLDIIKRRLSATIEATDTVFERSA